MDILVCRSKMLSLTFCRASLDREQRDTANSHGNQHDEQQHENDNQRGGSPGEAAVREVSVQTAHLHGGTLEATFRVLHASAQSTEQLVLLNQLRVYLRRLVAHLDKRLVQASQMAILLLHV